MAELEQRDEQDRALVTQLVDAAIAGEELDQHVARLAQLGDRPARLRLEQLHLPVTGATYRHGQAQRSDPDYLAWKDECGRLVAEWQRFHQQAETDEARYNALVRFASEH